MEYSGLHQRVRIVEKDNGTATSAKRFVWTPGGAQPAEERTDAGTSASKRFYFGGVRVGTTNYFYTRDHLGSIREVTNSARAVVAQYDYDLWGRRTKLAGSFDADFRFTGGYYHAPSDLHLAKYRAYAAESGRWLSRDPIGEEGGLNLYGYVENAPIAMYDYLGLAPGDIYPNPDAAAAAALSDVLPSTLAKNEEYGGRIQRTGKCYTYTAPHTDHDPKQVNVGPKGPNDVGTYHTHTGNPGDPEAENHSRQDMDTADSEFLPGYIGTPSGTMRRYTPKWKPDANGKCPFPRKGDVTSGPYNLPTR